MALSITLYKPILKNWDKYIPEGIKAISSKDNNEELMGHFSEFIYEKGELEINLAQGLKEKNVTQDEVIWVSTSYKNGFPVYHFSNKYTGASVIVDEIPLQITLNKLMYVATLDKIKIEHVPTAYTKLGRLGLTFVSKTEFIKEVSEFFPTYMPKISKWWDSTYDYQFKNGETFVHFY